MANPLNPVQEGVVGVDVPLEPSRDREGEHAQGKTRGKSKAPSVDALEPRIATLETSLSVAQANLEGLEERVTVSRENMLSTRWRQKPLSKSRWTLSDVSFNPSMMSC